MKSLLASLLLAAGLATSAFAADPGAGAPAPSDKAMIDYLIRQDQLHTEEIARLKAELARPKTREEAFAASGPTLIEVPVGDMPSVDQFR